MADAIFSILVAIPWSYMNLQKSYPCLKAQILKIQIKKTEA